MKKVALHNLGCKVNAYEMEVMQQMLQKSNYEIVPFDKAADIYIINTCTVTNIADKKSRQMLHRAKKQNPNATVVAVGCYAETDRERAAKDPCVDLLIGNQRKKDLVEILGAYEREKEEKSLSQEERKTLGGRTFLSSAEAQGSGGVLKGPAREIGKESAEESRSGGVLKGTEGRTRAYVKIQDGCNQFCSYCIIPYARGRVASRREKDILEEIRGIAEAGCQEAVLTGIHLSSYGMDLEEPAGRFEESLTRQQKSLLHLLSLVEGIGGIRRIRLGSLEPRIITEDFTRALCGIGKLCPHFHLSLQSGCDETLRRMNRHYTTGEYYDRVEILRKYFNSPAVTTDVIAGFPGETEEEFQATYRFLEQIRFYEMHVFKYSRRRGTKADAMDGQVEEAEKARRSALLLELTRRHSREFRESFLGKRMEILAEEEILVGKEKYLSGYTKRYLRAAVRSEGAGRNRLFGGMAGGFLTQDTLLLK